MSVAANRVGFLLAACTLFGSAALAQERLRPEPEPHYLALELWPTATGIEVGFDRALHGLAVCAASTSPATAKIRADLPPVLVDIQAWVVRVLDEDTRFQLRYWGQNYWAQFGVLEFDSGEIRVSRLVEMLAYM